MAGKAYFYALGQRDSSRSLPVRRAAINQFPGCWPEWAKVAYHHGYWFQGPWKSNLRSAE